MNNKNNIPNPKDISRFTRWVNELDDKDKTLDPLKRKSKWILITAFLFALFAISFIWFPTGKVKPQKVEAPQAGPVIEAPTNAGHSAFELPVDSFENQLKSYINEENFDK
ncbi:hypothetical protein SAMN05444285_105107 [Draconibacterium orientale]|uniref:Uncharacterized protein n=1 Tax=Draconibacterium orientale TaxID=1168034 RepID=X5E3U7_9BACT|nr:hypothetical protein [Draconibacterium orientale]AHW62135.1 hypothetical protein FH5T_15960 [Draconibacterium orientale]SET06218.1 hypothetical protein SAMN05444285_105107 [Draconibacterium orientale]